MVLGLAFLGITGGVTTRAAEIKLLCAVALHPAIDVLAPDFEKSSGHKVTVALTEMRALSRTGFKRVPLRGSHCNGARAVRGSHVQGPLSLAASD